MPDLGLRVALVATLLIAGACRDARVTVADAVLIAPSGARSDGFRASTVRRLTLPESGTYVMYVHTATVTSSGAFNIGLEMISPPGPIDAALSSGDL